MLKRTMLILIAPLLLGAGGATDAAKAELKKLQGTWKVVAVDVAGKRMPAEKIDGTQIVIKDSIMTIRAQDGKGNTMTFAVDPSTKPRSIDVTLVRGDDKIIWKCIYALEGNTFKFLMPMAPVKGQKFVGEPYGAVKRPESFDSKDKPFMIFTAERQKQPEE